MRIKDSIQRLGWRLKESVQKNRPFKPNQNDIDAFNTVVDFYNKMKDTNYRNNELMFKMYIWHRVEMMKHYDSDVFDTIPQKKLVETLCKPTNVFLSRLTEYLNSREYKVLINDLPHSNNPYFVLTEQQKNEADKILKSKLRKNPELFKDLVGDVWSIDDVEDNIVAEFNQLLMIA